MKNIITILVALLGAGHLFAANQETLDSNLEQLRPFLGSWRGEFKSSTPEKPLVDVAEWARALNGTAVRILHSINNGVYGGETLVTWDTEKKTLVYHYFTTAGFQTKGTMRVEGKTLVCHEIVTGNAEGTKEVKATVELAADGTMRSKSNT